MIKSARMLVILSVLLVLVLGALPSTAQGEPVTVRWFVGLGAGGQPEQIEAQNQVVEEFNATHDDIKIEINIVDNNVAYDTLSTLIASGDAPDIIGPVGTRGANAFAGSFLDLQPVIDSSGYDLSQFDPAAVDFYRENGELLGLPFAVFPSMLFYNVDLFDEADLDYPPHAYGEPYADGDEWTIEKMEEIAMLLTVDADGSDATMPDFDPENIIQWGFESQWNDDARAQAVLFGASNFVDESGNAVIPENWREAFHWYYDGIWSKHFIPNASQVASDTLGAGNAFSSGNVAMAHTHLWYTCCLGVVENWDLAALPSYDGAVTAKLHADTFRILKSTEHPEEAFEVLTYLIGDAAPTLLQVYGGMPARPEQQEAFFAALSETYPNVDWQVAIDSLAYADNPSHEGFMPNFNSADLRSDAFFTLYESTPGLDIDAELETLKTDLQAIFEGQEFVPPTPAAE